MEREVRIRLGENVRFVVVAADGKELVNLVGYVVSAEAVTRSLLTASMQEVSVPAAVTIDLRQVRDIVEGEVLTVDGVQLIEAPKPGG